MSDNQKKGFETMWHKGTKKVNLVRSDGGSPDGPRAETVRTQIDAVMNNQ